MELIKNIYQGQLDPPEGEVWFGLFDKYISFAIEDSADIEYATKCAEYLNNLSEEIIRNICEASIRYCNSFLDAICEPTIEFNNYKDVLPKIYPSTLLIPDPENGDEPIVHMELNCEWEPEHGMEWIVRGKEVLYVGAFNGTYPWAEISKSDSWNYA
ncbi:hypothetical protein [Thalassolituus sp. C2-1]|uniref:DUF6985 domain-containing protein n=1 Tax=Venatorbacter sp. C2-1 TaxID=2597518 RepID=UPI00119479A9|nr:hypothetical protein [Thalassolituus sp. C2-1]TVV43150.1 hypothetical protein FOT50_11970 [Thalassolituus sp. C2-1]